MIKIKKQKLEIKLNTYYKDDKIIYCLESWLNDKKYGWKYLQLEEVKELSLADYLDNFYAEITERIKYINANKNKVELSINKYERNKIFDKIIDLDNPFKVEFEYNNFATFREIQYIAKQLKNLFTIESDDTTLIKNYFKDLNKKINVLTKNSTKTFTKLKELIDKTEIKNELKLEKNVKFIV